MVKEKNELYADMGLEVGNFVKRMDKLLHTYNDAYMNMYEKYVDIGVMDILSIVATYKDKIQQGGVYVVKNNLNNKYKIGYTSNFEKRLKQLKTSFIHIGMEHDLSVVRLIYCFDDFAFNLEQKLHKLLGEYRDIGEWFSIKDINEFTRVIKEGQIDFGTFGLYIDHDIMKVPKYETKISKSYIITQKLCSDMGFDDKDMINFLLYTLDKENNMSDFCLFINRSGDLKPIQIGVFDMVLEYKAIVVPSKNGDLYRVGESENYTTYSDVLYGKTLDFILSKHGIMDKFTDKYIIEDLYDEASVSDAARDYAKSMIVDVQHRSEEELNAMCIHPQLFRDEWEGVASFARELKDSVTYLEIQELLSEI